jgi:hypothetical protein
MKTRCFAIFDIRGPDYAICLTTALATSSVTNTTGSRQPLDKSRRLLGGFHLGVFRLSHVGNARLERTGKGE